jgi:hypothetical protein
MTTQLELMRILNATNNFYETPGTRTWETAVTSHAVLFYDDNRNIDFIFELNPETFTIKMWAVQNQHKITVFTPTITLGSSRIAPDIILALHTLFEFDFASDATFVVQNAWISQLPATRPKHRRQNASDATAAVHSPSSSSSSTSSIVSNSAHGSTSVDSVASSRRVRLLKRLLFLRP